MFKHIATIILALLAIASFLAACDSPPIPPTVNPAPVTTAVTPVPDGEDDPIQSAVTPTPPREIRQLTICTGPEPVSLFPYGSLSASTRSIFQAVYDGPVDYNGFSLTPVILEQIPTVENGDAFFEPVEVIPGDIIVDNNGAIDNLREGTVYRPSGCSSPECATSFSGAGAVQVDQLVVRFRLLPGLQWSDGSLLTAQDSLYAYEVAKEIYPAYRPELVRLTHSYQSIDPTTLEWRGLPGSQAPGYSENLFSPLPEQAWEEMAVSELAESEISSRKPLGWGPYRIDEWSPGQHITLSKNPNYFRADEDLPRFDRLVFRFTTSTQEATQALMEGECDLADEVSLVGITSAELKQIQSETSVLLEPGGAWEQILFGITPLDEARPAFFSSPEVRRAVATCIDREGIMTELYPGLTLVPDAFVLPDHPLYPAEITPHIYDPQAASDLLTASGWIDHDNNSGTPRLAQGAQGVPDGTPFEIIYLASNDAERELSARRVQVDLLQCGIQVNLILEDASQVYTSGPEGLIFGRQFDAAQLAWTGYSELPCSLYSSDEIAGPYPEFPNGWGGANASGFNNPDFDQACRTILSTLKDSPAFANAYRQAHIILSDQLPALPLYLQMRVAAARNDLCGFELDPSTPHSLWNMEALDYGAACTP